MLIPVDASSVVSFETSSVGFPNSRGGVDAKVTDTKAFVVTLFFTTALRGGFVGSIHQRGVAGVCAASRVAPGRKVGREGDI